MDFMTNIMLRIFKKYFKKVKIKDKIFKEYKSALNKRDYIRTSILSERFLKLK